MSANQSNLSAVSPSWDVVVATAQNSVDTVMKELLMASHPPEIVLCHYTDPESGASTPIDYATVKQRTGVDPFAVPDGSPRSNAAVQALASFGFQFGIKATIGFPPGVDPSALPLITTLVPQASWATYTLMFSEFVLVQLSQDGSWFNQPQPPGSPWFFTFNANLLMAQVPVGDYASLPQAVQAAVDEQGGNSFIVQQLSLDLSTANPVTSPTITTDSSLASWLASSFVGEYLAAFGAAGAVIPPLGYALTPPSPSASTLAITGVVGQVPPFIDSSAPLTPDQQALVTLDYLCLTGGDPLPAQPLTFGWNWLDAGEESLYDGVIAVNRNTLAQYLRSAPVVGSLTLDSYVASNCYLPAISSDGTLSLTPGQAPTIEMTPTMLTGSEQVFSYAWSSPVVTYKHSTTTVECSSSFTLTVSFSGSSIVIDQHLIVYVWVKVDATSAGGNVMDVELVDTCALAVDQAGHLTAVTTSNRIDDSQTPAVNGFLDFWTNINELIKTLANAAQSFTSTSLVDIPASFVQSFVFPGGNAFVFDDASFSQYQDLVAHIRYQDPT